jgi:glycosyltransferase involved in cell wall biosynthesis
MRALHVFPLLNPALATGSDYHQFMLTRELVRQGVEVDVYTTWSGHLEHRSAFGLGWPADYPLGPMLIDGVRVHRFAATRSLPPALGHLVSGVIQRRWCEEARRDGCAIDSAEETIAVMHRRARSRPRIYDYLALFGRGPHSPHLMRAARRAAPHYDVLFAGYSPFATLWYVTRLAERVGKPLVLLPLFHPEDRSHHFQSLYWCFERADALLAQTAYSAALFQRLMPGANPVQVGPAVDPDDYTDARCDGARFRARYGLANERIVLCVGRKEHHKRYDLAVEAIDRLADERTVLVMIGADIDRQPITSPYVRYLGPLEKADLLDAYDACDVFVLPSEYESFGLVFLEAWMRKKPVIGNAACRPVASVIHDGHDGFLAATAEEIATHLRTLLADPARRRAVGAAGYAKVTGRYTWPHVAGIVRSVYDDVTARRRHSAAAA